MIYTRSKDDSYDWKVGDIYGLYFESKGRIAHVGVVLYVSADGSYMVGVEGNTNAHGECGS